MKDAEKVEDAKDVIDSDFALDHCRLQSRGTTPEVPCDMITCLKRFYRAIPGIARFAKYNNMALTARMDYIPAT